MNDALDVVWRRAELANHVLSAGEIAAWEPGERETLLKLGVIRRTSDATELICDDCGLSHAAEILRDGRKPQDAYYLCPEIGRIAVAPGDLHRWEADFEQIAALIRGAVGLTAKATTLFPSRIWLLGRQQSGDTYWELFLMRGLSWPDGLGLLDQCTRLQQSPTPVVLVPYLLPAGANSRPIRTLSEIATIRGSGLVIDVQTLKTAACALCIPPSLAPRRKAPPKRMSRSLGSPEALQIMTQYLERTNLRDTEFGNQFGTTDRTIRKFRSTGKMRRSNFEAMAKWMGLTPDELLAGKLPRLLETNTSR